MGVDPLPQLPSLFSGQRGFPASQVWGQWAGSLESGGRMWEISWNVQVFFFFFVPPTQHTHTLVQQQRQRPPLLFSSPLCSFGAVAPCSDLMEQGEEHSKEIQSPEVCKRSATVPKWELLYVIRDERTCLVWPVFRCREQHLRSFLHSSVFCTLDYSPDNPQITVNCCTDLWQFDLCQEKIG